MGPSISAVTSSIIFYDRLTLYYWQLGYTVLRTSNTLLLLRPA